LFVLHAVQLSMVPALLVQAGLLRRCTGKISAGAVLASSVVGGTLFPARQRGLLRAVLLAAIACWRWCNWVSWEWPWRPAWRRLWMLGAFAAAVFCSFNVLGNRPSLVMSRPQQEPRSNRGAGAGDAAIN
jgi:hypothetical protein